jgi:hypothetical protein
VENGVFKPALLAGFQEGGPAGRGNLSEPLKISQVLKGGSPPNRKRAKR